MIGSHHRNPLIGRKQDLNLRRILIQTLLNDKQLWSSDKYYIVASPWKREARDKNQNKNIVYTLFDFRKSLLKSY